MHGRLTYGVHLAVLRHSDTYPLHGLFDVYDGCIWRPNHADFRIGITCTLSHETDAVTLLFDELWDDDPSSFSRAIGDTNRAARHPQQHLYHCSSDGHHDNSINGYLLAMGIPGIKPALLYIVCRQNFLY